MRLESLFATGRSQSSLAELPMPVDLDRLLPGTGAWEVELGFGKGRHLLRSAIAEPGRRFLGVEVVSRYFRMLRDRGRRQGVSNLVTARGEALYLLSSVLPRGFAEVLHVYFPDPWPKARHHKRRLFDPETVDLVVGVLRPGGRLYFATDFLGYGERVAEILEGFPGLEVERRAEPWSDGARTNYEAKYQREGRPILRLEARLNGAREPCRLHPEGEAGILSAVARRELD